MRFDGFARNRMTSASGITWVAREPKLMDGAKGARIRTEIYRLPRPHPVPQIRATKGLSLNLAAESGALAVRPLWHLLYWTQNSLNGRKKA
jgi:hypothetical protein